MVWEAIMGSDTTFGTPGSAHINPIEWEEHGVIGGVHGKKVFLVDSKGNQIDYFPRPNYSLKETVVGTIIYLARALPGSSQSNPVWQAMKVDGTTGIVVTWADGNSNFDNVATDLTTLSYS